MKALMHLGAFGLLYIYKMLWQKILLQSHRVNYGIRVTLSQFGLVCSHLPLLPLLTSTYMLGIIVATLTVGPLSGCILDEAHWYNVVTTRSLWEKETDTFGLPSSPPCILGCLACSCNFKMMVVMHVKRMMRTMRLK